MYVRILEAEISENKGDSGLVPIKKVPKGSRMVTLRMTSRDTMTSLW